MSTNTVVPLRERFVDIAVLIVVFVGVWEVAHQWAGDVALTSPWDTIKYSIQTLFSASFWPHVWATMSSFAIAMVVAAFSGILIGAVLGYNRLAGEVAEPILVGVYSIPKVTLYPIILLFFGIGSAASVAFGALHGIVPISLFTMNAVRNIKPVYLKTAKVLRLTPRQLLLSILLPASLPEVFTGLRVGFSLTLVGTLLAEMFGSRQGLGHMLMNAIGMHDMDVIMSITLLLALFAVIVNSGLLWIDRRLHRTTVKTPMGGA
ncbi:oligopeptide transporter permease [Antarctobacter heliothermus]|uniref:Oligopeptide transporter permease n=1 Tax=Antarctobacter heliothermus TaxID=74033 RepID=A0A222E781_9RHOB|nr:ABC transporter permease [Antarctobacter heliothermus]ASP21801.1 oligopeptide transporter permease [Antarctobacter heliothermus]MBT55963.1 ABC transporter permease [Mameliella sp.]|tara:strand:+ start:10877 stop:11662 length:786 start_codon:yes stop_codon:yes gene_type:complete